MICPACTSDRWAHSSSATQLSTNLNPVPCEYYECSSCGLGRRMPEPDPSALKDYYQKAWQFSQPRPWQCLYRAAQFIFQASNQGEWLSVIDLGSKGAEMEAALNEFGVVGSFGSLDAGPVSAAVEPAWIGEGYVSEKKYALVLATHVLEHSIDPRRFLTDLTTFLAPDGIAYVEVPSLELGANDAGLCDDMNPNHLWHFTIPSLSMLFERSGLEVVSIKGDPRPDGWPVVRAVARMALGDSRIASMHCQIARKYAEAVSRMQAALRPGDALYGASGSCFQLMPYFRDLPIFDLYKHGRKISWREILDPAKMPEMGVRRVWLTPRFWNSQVEIKRWLNKNYPTIEVLSPYA